MKIKLWIIIAVAVLVLTACGSGSQSKSLDGTSWELISFQDAPVMEGVLISVEFRDGQVNGSAGCNSYFGAYDVRGDNLSIGQVGMTEMFCMDPTGVMDLEMQFAEWLMDTQTFDIIEKELKIYRSSGDALTFIPRE